MHMPFPNLKLFFLFLFPLWRLKRLRHRDHLAAFCYANFFAIAFLDTHSRRLSSVRIDQGYIRNVDPGLLFNDSALDIHLWNGLAMTLYNHRTFDLDLAVTGIDFD